MGDKVIKENNETATNCATITTFWYIINYRNAINRTQIDIRPILNHYVLLFILKAAKANFCRVLIFASS